MGRLKQRLLHNFMSVYKLCTTKLVILVLMLNTRVIAGSDSVSIKPEPMAIDEGAPLIIQCELSPQRTLRPPGPGLHLEDMHGTTVATSDSPSKCLKQRWHPCSCECDESRCKVTASLRSFAKTDVGEYRCTFGVTVDSTTIDIIEVTYAVSSSNEIEVSCTNYYNEEERHKIIWINGLIVASHAKIIAKRFKISDESKSLCCEIGWLKKCVAIIQPVTIPVNQFVSHSKVSDGSTTPNYISLPTDTEKELDNEGKDEYEWFLILTKVIFAILLAIIVGLVVTAVVSRINGRHTGDTDPRS